MISALDSASFNAVKIWILSSCIEDIWCTVTPILLSSFPIKAELESTI